MVGGDYVMRNVNALARRGRLVNIAYQKGAKVEVDFRIVQNRLLSLSATGLRGRPDSEKGEIREAVRREGPIHTLPLARVPAAVRRKRETA